MIGMNAERRLLDGFAQKKEWLVFTALALRDDDSPLGGHFLREETAVGHTICFEAEGKIDLISGHGLEVGCPIHVRKGIPGSALARDRFIENIGRELLGPLELHVFYPV